MEVEKSEAGTEIGYRTVSDGLKLRYFPKTPRSLASTPRGPMGMQDQAVRSRLQASGQIPGLHAALRNMSRRGGGHEETGVWEGSAERQESGEQLPGVEAALSTPREQAQRGAVRGGASGKMDARTYLGSRQHPRDMTLKAYNRDIDKPMRLIKTRPIVDLRGTIPSLAQMGWAEAKMATRHHEPSPDAKNAPGKSLSSSSSTTGTEASAVRAMRRHDPRKSFDSKA